MSAQEIAESIVEVAVLETGRRLPGVRDVSGYRERTTAPVVRRELPRPWLTLVWELGPSVEHLRRTAPARDAGGFVAGLHFQPGMTRVQRAQHGVCVALDPLAARAVLGLPLDALTDQVVGLNDVLPRDERPLGRRLSELPGWAEQLAAIEAFVVRRLAAAPAPHPIVPHALDRIIRTDGQVRLKDLAAETGYSAKHLIACFHDNVGTSPKQFARLVRFHRAQQLLARGRGSVASIAALTGFADQAHLTRELRAFGVATPAAEQAYGLSVCQQLRETPRR